MTSITGYGIDLPPHNPEAEQAVLGSLLIDRDAILQVSEWLTPEAFYDAVNGTIYRAMLALFAARRPCDLLTLTNLLQDRGRLEEIGGMAYISQLITAVPTAVHVLHYAEIVIEHARRRALIDAAAELVRIGYQSADPIAMDELLGDARRRVEQFAVPVESTSTRLSEYMDEHRNRVVDRWEGRLIEHVVPTGIGPLDRITMGGMRPGDLIVIGGRPGMGKTSKMWQIAQHAANRTRRLSIIVELEMSKEALVNRAIAAEANVPFGVAYERIGDSLKRELWLAASERLEQMPVAVESTWRTTDQIFNAAAKLAASEPIGAIFIDHLGFLADRIRGDGEEQRTSEIVRRCKAMAQHLDVPVVLLSQLNRDVERNPPFIPGLKNFKYSGEIEASADHAWLLYRRMYYVEKNLLQAEADDWVIDRMMHRVELIVAKNRNGAVQTIQLGWRPETMTFHEVAA